MDRSPDFELPSPKRVRLEAPEHEAAIAPITPVNDTNDLHGKPMVQPSNPIKDSGVLAPECIPPTYQKLFQLPGLGMLDEDPIPSSQNLQKQSETLSFSDAELSSPKVNVEDMELEDDQKPHVNGGLDVAFNDKRIVNIQITEPEHISPVSSEIPMDGNATAITKHEGLASEVEAPVDQDVTRSRSKWAQTTLDWHSSGTVVDNRIWLGGCSTEKAIARAPHSNNSRASTDTEVLKDTSIDQVGVNVEHQLSSAAEPVAEWSEKTISTEPNFDKGIEEAEFELDSSPLGSDSSSADSSDTSSSDDSDADDYEMLGPAEQARRLMAEDGGSDDDGKGKGRKAVAEVPRTLNEKPEELVPKPSVSVTEDMKIEGLGLVENTIENLVLIKANTSGEYEVLESGSLLCLEDRSVVGVISETLGRVQQPYYSVRFTNATAIAEAGIEKGTKIFYVAQHSTRVFTQPLKAFRGSDASNLHDEEVGDDELEFSDDEAEAEHKRQVKQQRTAKRNARDGQPDGFSRGPQQRPGGPSHRLDGGLHPIQERPPNSAEAALDYDGPEVMNVDKKEDEDGLYTPLTRPSNLHEILSGKTPPMNSHGGPANNNRGRGGSRGGNRGRGDNRGRGSNRGMRDSERRGGRQNGKDHGNRGGKGQAYGPPISSPTLQTNGFSPPQTNGLPPRPNAETTAGYQWSTHQNNGFSHPPPQHSPIPSPAYQAQHQAQFSTQPGYPPQYPTAYNHSYVQPPPPPHQSYPSHVPQQQQKYPQYHQPPQSVSHQGYPQQFASQPDMSFPPRQQYPPSMPPGAHINPNYFKQQAQASLPQGWQQGYNHQQQQQQQLASPASNNMGPPAPAAASSGTRLEELLRGLGNGGG